MEEWRPVVGWEGLYEVSDHGNVRSLTRKVSFGRGTRIAHGKVLKLVVTGAVVQYHVVTLQSPDRRNSVTKVHRLVLDAFVGPCPPGMEGCHGPLGSLVNTPDNLRWDTRLENIRDQVRQGTNSRMRRTRCPRGHLLKAPNLLKRRNRVCRACKAADYDIQAKGAPAQEARDRHYLRVMLGGS